MRACACVICINIYTYIHIMLYLCDAIYECQQVDCKVSHGSAVVGIVVDFDERKLSWFINRRCVCRVVKCVAV